MIEVNLTANTDLRSVDEFKESGDSRERRGAGDDCADIADIALGAEDYSAEVRFSGQTAVFMGIFRCPTLTPSMWSSGFG
jgi:multidrug efflux pump